jgi:hypothetical protein
MAHTNGAEEIWLPVTGRALALAFMCLRQEEQERLNDFECCALRSCG